MSTTLVNNLSFCTLQEKKWRKLHRIGTGAAVPQLLMATLISTFTLAFSQLFGTEAGEPSAAWRMVKKYTYRAGEVTLARKGIKGTITLKMCLVLGASSAGKM